jgi:hypothetical protein
MCRSRVILIRSEVEPWLDDAKEMWALCPDASSVQLLDGCTAMDDVSALACRDPS